MGEFYKGWIPAVSGALSFKNFGFSSQAGWNKVFFDCRFSVVSRPIDVSADTISTISSTVEAGDKRVVDWVFAACGTFDLSDKPWDNLRASAFIRWLRLTKPSPGAYRKFMVGWSVSDQDDSKKTIEGLIFLSPDRFTAFHVFVDHYMLKSSNNERDKRIRDERIRSATSDVRSVAPELMKTSLDAILVAPSSGSSEVAVEDSFRSRFSTCIGANGPALAFVFRIERSGEVLLKCLNPQEAKTACADAESKDSANDISDHLALHAYSFLKRLWHADKHHPETDDKIQDVHRVGSDFERLDDVKWRLNLLHGLYGEVIKLNKAGNVDNLHNASGILSYAEAFRSISYNRLGFVEPLCRTTAPDIDTPPSVSPSLKEFISASTFNASSARLSWDALQRAKHSIQEEKRAKIASVRQTINFILAAVLGVIAIYALTIPVFQMVFTEEFRNIVIGDQTISDNSRYRRSDELRRDFNQKKISAILQPEKTLPPVTAPLSYSDYYEQNRKQLQWLYETAIREFSLFTGQFWLETLLLVVKNVEIILLVIFFLLGVHWFTRQVIKQFERIFETAIYAVKRLAVVISPYYPQFLVGFVGLILYEVLMTIYMPPFSFSTSILPRLFAAIWPHGLF